MGLFLTLPLIGTLSQVTGKLPDYYKVFYEYNAPFTIIGAIALFLAFRNMRIKGAKINKVINWVAGLTFGVYLLHEHVLLRPLWKTFWQVPEYYKTPYFLLHMVGVVALVFLAGCVVEALRRLLFKGISKLLHLEKLEAKLSKADTFFNENKSEDES